MAQADAEKLATLFERQARPKLRQNAKKAVQDAGGSSDLAEFFDGLSTQEINTLIKTWDEMQRLNITGAADGETVSFL